MVRALPDLLRAADAVRARGGALGHTLHVLGETTSTNDEAKRGAKNGAPHGSVWVAESQLAGRGRQGRAWVSSPGENLLFSVLLRVACPASRLPLLALVAGLAVRDAVANASPGADVKVKWPNDVVVLGDAARGRAPKKMAGVLVETTMTAGKVEAVVVGVGVNVHARSFPEDLADRATSVALVSSRCRPGCVADLPSRCRPGCVADLPSRCEPGCVADLPSRPPDRAEILADVLHALDRDVELVAARGLGLVHARLVAADALSGERVTSEQGEGVAEGIDMDGRLVVRKDDGVVTRWIAGEVHLVQV